KLAAQVRAEQLEAHYYWQLEQQLLVTGAEKVIFVCSDGTENNFVSMEYYPVPGRAEALAAGWKQFAADLEEQEAPAAKPVEKIGRAPEMLPAIHVEVTGMVKHSNLDQFRAMAMEAI
ncbi:Heme peroxidase, partial [Pseudomonas chengduensis]